jgi:anti-sigma-K factor RskA
LALKHDRANDEVQELAALFALGSLGEEEARDFKRHLEDGCVVCQGEVAQFQKVAVALSFGAPGVIPPENLRDSLMTRIGRRPAVVAIPRPSRSIQVGWALAACFALVSVASILMWRGAQSEVEILQTRLAVASERASQLDQVAAVLRNPGARVITLKGQPEAPASQGSVYWDVNGRRWVVEAVLPPAPSGKVYQLWFVTPEEKRSAGLLRTDTEGRAFNAIQVPGDLGQIQAAAITLEPEGGSAQPTMPIYAVGATE